MDRQGEQITPIASRSMMATVGGGVLLFLSVLPVDVALGATRPNAGMSGSADLQLAMRWVQPILGRAIVENELIKQHGREIGHGGKAINAMTTIASPPDSGNHRAQGLAYAKAMEADHAALVQWVVGRLIVELTRHRMGAGDPTVYRLGDEGNQRITAIARQTLQQFNDAFRTGRQAKLGRAIVTETANEGRTVERDPEEVGLIF